MSRSLIATCFQLCLALAVLGTSNAVRADDSQPLVVHIKEIQANTYHLRWTVPLSVSARNIPTILLPETCKYSNDSTVQRGGATRSGQSFFRCSMSLSGQSVAIQYPIYDPATSSFLKYETLTGEQHTSLLKPQDGRWLVPSLETKSQIASDYTRLGIAHIWAGTDHLLFLVCLLFIAGDVRRVLITITGFTLAHSITLGLSALDVIQLPVRAVEAVIALSIVFLATEIVRNKRDTLTWRYPIAVSSSFGLVHGLGFAAVLSEIGLPQVELFTGLLFFNIGVEIGQILFVAAVFLALQFGRRLFEQSKGIQFMIPSLRLGAGYMIGGLASFWVMERMV